MKNIFSNKGVLFVFVFLNLSTVAFAGEIVRLTSKNLNLIPRGKEVDAMIGDWVIKNDKVIAIIGDVYEDREANQMVSSIQGAVIDFTSLKDNNDQLTVYYPQGARIDVPSAHNIRVIKADGKTVELKVIKNATEAEPFIAETTYSLTDREEFLRISTTYKNTSNKAIKIRINDVLRCDNGLEDITPAGESDMAFVYNKWYHSAYGILSTDRKLHTFGVPEKKGLATLGHQVFFVGLADNPGGNTVLKAGQEITLSRILVTGKSVADLQRLENSLTSSKYQSLKIHIEGKLKNNLANVYVDARNEKNEIVSSSLTDSKGNAVLLLPIGDFNVSVSKIGHDMASKTVSIKESVSPINFVLQPESSLSFKIRDQNDQVLPVKIEFRGINGTKKPNLGPETRSSGTGNLYYSFDSEFSVPIPEGDYRIIVSHGPEYDVQILEAKAVPGKERKLDVIMKRAFTSPNYIIADLHNHTTGSGDSNAEREDRVLNMAASGIEFAPATEHNRISSFSNVIKEMGLQKFIASAAGIELSGRPGPGSINHQIGFPLKIQPEKRGYGAPKTDRDPYVQMKRLYEYDNRSYKLMQQNHPEISQLYFDKDKDGVADKGFGTEEFTDVMEIRESMLDLPAAVNGGEIKTRSFQWLQMLNLGYRIYGTANTDAHTVGNGSGSMFNYIYTAYDEPERVDPLEIVKQLKHGHNIMSNGPFMTVAVNDALPGDEIKALDGKVQVKVKILVANWCKVNTVQLLVNGKADPALTFTKDESPTLFADGTDAFQLDLPLTLKTDAHIIALAYGKDEDIGLVNGGKKNMPLALSNPVFVDIDGTGFKANKDLLGGILPIKL